MFHPKQVLLAGGGTGGHLFPGIAIAQKLKDTGLVEPLFVTTGRAMESPHLTRYGFRSSPLPSPQWTSNPLKFPSFAKRFSQSLLGMSRIFKSGRPHAVIGLGGYGAVAPCLWAVAHGIPVFLLEQNVLPGRATRLLSRFADEIYLQWEASRRYLSSGRKCLVTGNPLRKEMAPIPRHTAASYFGLSADRFTLLVMGGSQGAHALNELMIQVAPRLGKISRAHVKEESTPSTTSGTHPAKANVSPWRALQVIHLSGTKDASAVQREYSSAGVTARTIEFLEEMQIAYSLADLAIGRAGGTSIAELVRFKIPAILIPYPFARDRHQDFNAEEMRKVGAALVYHETRINAEILCDAILTLMRSPEKLADMSRAAGKLSPAKPAADVICERIICSVRTR